MPEQSVKSIGWDIGIKNLAYCIIVPKDIATNETITINNHHYEIENWRDISLVTEIENNLNNSGEASLINLELKCTAAKTDKIGETAKCGTNAHYCLETKTVDGAYQGRCKKHFKKEGHVRLPEVTVKKCYAKDCTAKCAQILRDHVFIGYCKKHITEMIKAGSKTEGDFFKINKAKKTATINLNHLGVALFKELDKTRDIMLAPDNVLLENQPVLKNPTMKSMQMFLYSYYLMRGMDNNTVSDKHIQCYCAGKKLDLIKFLPESEQTRITDALKTVKSGYQQNKQMSIHLVEYLLRGNTKWNTFFANHKKRDDLADSLLMTLHYLEKGNLAKLVKALKKGGKKTEKQTNGKKCIGDYADEYMDMPNIDEDLD